MRGERNRDGDREREEMENEIASSEKRGKSMREDEMAEQCGDAIIKKKKKKGTIKRARDAEDFQFSTEINLKKKQGEKSRIDQKIYIYIYVMFGS